MDIGGGTLAAMDAHGMNPAAVLAMAGDLGARVGRVLVLGCEVAQVAEGMGLSAPVAAAVPAARRALGDLVASLAGAEDPLTVTVSTPSFEEAPS